MTPVLCIVLLAVLWIAAAVFWLADAPNPRHVADVVLQRSPLDEPVGATAQLVA